MLKFENEGKVCGLNHFRISIFYKSHKREMIFYVAVEEISF
jgi:hypothetical protein